MQILPAEAGLDETHISFSKGCYPGQEPIARQRYRGKVNSQAARAGRSKATRPQVTELLLDGKKVGRITSAVPGVALGYVRCREVPTDAQLEARREDGLCPASLITATRTKDSARKHHGPRSAAASRGHAPGKIRTCDLCLRRAALYPLSYGRPEAASSLAR